MEMNSNNGGLIPSAIALKNSLNQKPATLSDPTMLTPYQQELLRQGEREIDECLAQAELLAIPLSILKTVQQQAAD